MDGTNIKIKELLSSRNLTDSTNFITVIANAIITAHNSGLLKLEKVPALCEKCKRDTSEWVITITGVFKWIFSFRLTAEIHAFWDETCGLSYFRIKFVK